MDRIRLGGYPQSHPQGASPATIIAALERAHAAGIAISATVLLGLGGRHLWQEHIDGTVDVINRASLAYLSTLQLRLEDDAVDDFIGRFDRNGGFPSRGRTMKAFWPSWNAS